MNRQAIIDLISKALCNQENLIFVIFGKTQAQANDLMNEISHKIPDYVGLKQLDRGKWTSNSDSRVYCYNESSNVKGLSFNAAYILRSVNPAKAAEIKEYLHPAGPTFQET